jgi:PAS domain-containing protein
VAAVAAVGNKEEDYDQTDIRQLTLFMNGMWWLLERQKTQAALAAEIERMHEFQSRLIQTSADGIIANDPHGNIILFNQGAEKTLGYAAGGGHRPAGRDPPVPPGGGPGYQTKRLSVPNYGGPGRLERYETRVLAKNGEEIPIELSAAVILEDSQEVAVVGFFRDLRERQKLLERVLESERLAAIGRMAAHLSS